MRYKQKKHQTSRRLWKYLCLSGFQHGRSCPETSLRPPIDLPSELPSAPPASGMKRNHFVVDHIRLHIIYNSDYPKREIMGGVTGGLWEMLRKLISGMPRQEASWLTMKHTMMKASSLLSRFNIHRNQAQSRNC